ncbi:unnamed protein product [Linum trigynum]|uniref:RNase H type-1 domain-containing protein n=1 Tax=Linum trigynum TaxID=586398 RepID=A0AAV2CBL7_9ROSI
MQVIKLSDHQRFFEVPLQDWLLKNLHHPDYDLSFGLICLSLWKTRNDRVFSNKTVTTEAFLQRIRAWINVVRTALDKDGLVHMPTLPTRTEAEISWKPPPPEWVTLNSDGSVLHDTGQAAAGGLLRDHTRRCLAAFACNLGYCSITQAELRGAVEGLQLAWTLGYRRVRVELDSCCAILLLEKRTGDTYHHTALVDWFQELQSRGWEVSISHIYREANKCADGLASYGHSLPPGVHAVSCSVPFLYHFLMYDGQGLSEPRLVLNES